MVQSACEKVTTVKTVAKKAIGSAGEKDDVEKAGDEKRHCREDGRTEKL